ncbi:hypothetical protein TREES_T100020803 [Tupaia chinensis]|uniref:N-acetyltransferase domain-containing protein n=1 Tax=Tupaia chinensis TaxID=246437 RepID=L9K1T4_TUPCH|nr:hypothetical protein TREES_T100020803 [Tupaia chinensis]
MKLEAIATSEIPKPEMDAGPDESWPQEAEAKPRTESGPEAEAEPLDFVVATEQEFEEVLAISGGIYGGLDYLPSRYHSWLRDPNRTVVLAKRNGGVIALESVNVIDAGETALVEGLRVAPWERGKGVARLLQRFCSQLVKQQHPGVKVARLTRDDQLGPRELKKYRLITKQVFGTLIPEASLLPSEIWAFNLPHSAWALQGRSSRGPRWKSVVVNVGANAKGPWARQPSHRAVPPAHWCPPQGILLVRFNATALLAGLGARLAALQKSGTFSLLPTEAVNEAGGDVERLLLSPSVQGSRFLEPLSLKLPCYPQRSGLSTYPTLPGPFKGILLVRFNATALLAGLGARLAALQKSGTFSLLPTEAVNEAGGDVERLLLSPSVQRDVLPGGTIIQDWQPYRPSESNLRLLAAKGLEWRVDSRTHPRVLTLCTRPFPIPHGGDGTWRYLNIDAFGSDGAQVQSQLLWHLQRQAPRLAGLNVMCQLFLAPQLWSQLADFCQAGLGLELVKGYTEQYLLEVDI